MKIIDANKLNRFWKNGVKPIEDLAAKKLDTSKVINNLLTTKAGYALDARQGKVLQDQVSEINSNLSELNTGLKNLISTSSYTQAYTIAANGYTDVIINTAVSGKRVIGMTMRTTGHPNIYAYAWAVRSDQNVGVGLRNISNGEINGNVMVDILYANL